jgi:hypothetical protein
MPARSDRKAAGPGAQAARRRLRGLAIHLFLGTAIAAIAVVIDISQHGVPAWSALLVVGWGGALALHVGYVMGLFDGFSRRPRD